MINIIGTRSVTKAQNGTDAKHTNYNHFIVRGVLIMCPCLNARQVTCYLMRR